MSIEEKNPIYEVTILETSVYTVRVDVPEHYQTYDANVTFAKERAKQIVQSFDSDNYDIVEHTIDVISTAKINAQIVLADYETVRRAAAANPQFYTARNQNYMYDAAKFIAKQKTNNKLVRFMREVQEGYLFEVIED